MRPTRLRTPLLLLPLLGLLRAGVAAGQEPDSVAAIPIAPVTVTVLRTPLELARVPYSVSVRGREQIQRGQPGLGLDEALRGVPGVQVDNRYNYALGERISIRGFGARAQFGVRGVRVLVDGIPATLPDGQTSLSHVDLGFLRRAEVIRGPASALYGNTAGGVIQLETELPPAAALSQEVGVVGGSNGLLRAHSTTGGRSGRASYLLNLSRLAYGGFREFNDAENLHLNARLGWDAERTSARLLAAAVDYDARNPGSLSAELLREDRSQAYSNNRRQRTGETGRQGQLGATLRHRAAAGEWELSGYALGREVDNPIPNAIIDLERAAGGVRALFRSAPLPGVGGARLSIGAEADQQRDDRLNFANQEGERGALTLDQRERVTTAGAFAQLVVAPLPRLSLLAGGRYDWFRFRADDRLVAADNPDDSGERTLDAFSPSLGATLDAGEALQLFGNVATSFETPTTTELANRPDGAGGFNPELQPQRTLSLEAGARGRVAERLAYEAAVYHAAVEDALIPFEVPEAPGRQFFRNAGSATHRGVELGLTAVPLPRTRLQASYTHTDARFRDYAVEGEVLDGNRVPGVAPHRAELIASLGGPSGWFATVETRYVSAIPVNDDNTARSPAYWVADLRAGLERVRLGRLELEPFAGVGNLFGREYNASVVVNAFGARYYEPAPGRTLHAGINVRM